MVNTYLFVLPNIEEEYHKTLSKSIVCLQLCIALMDIYKYMQMDVAVSVIYPY